MRKIIGFTLILCTTFVWGQTTVNNAVNTFVSNPIIRNANVSLLIKDIANGREVASYRANAVTPPASTMKLITTSTALEMLGPDFQFETFLETDGTIENGTLNGNLYIRGTGDPTLGSSKMGKQNFLYTWAAKIKQAGIEHINGSIIGDASFFAAEAINPQWIWEDIGNFYAPSIFSLSYLDNTLNIQLMSGAVGSKVEVIKTIPAIENLQFENHLTCTAIDYDGAYVHGLPYNNTRYLVGSVPSNQGLFGVRGDIPNPPLLLAQHFTERLVAIGVSVSGVPNYQSSPTKDSPRQIIYTHKSPQLSKIICEINQHSNNHYAEHLFRYLGSRMHTPANIKGSVDIIKSFWKARLLNLDYTFICDGSGLSPQNAISADTFVQILTYMLQISSYKNEFMASLPVSGEIGTLVNFLKNSELQGRICAKSGTTSRIKSYAGYINTTDGQQYIFAIIVNNGYGKPITVQKEIEKFLLDVCKSNK